MENEILNWPHWIRHCLGSRKDGELPGKVIP